VLSKTVASALDQGKAFSEVKASLDQVVAQYGVPVEDIHNALVQGWSTGAARIALAEPLSMDKHLALVDFYRGAGLTGEELVKTDGFKTVAASLILWCVMNGVPQNIACEFTHPFNLQINEVPLMFFGSAVYSQETITRSYQGGYAGVSVRVGHGLYYHLGGLEGQSVEKATLQEIDYGGLLFTTNNLYFGGEHKVFRVPYEHIVSFRPFANGIGIFRDGANAKTEVFTIVNAWSSCGAFLYNLAHFLAQPEARALYAAITGNPDGVLQWIMNYW